MGAFKSLALKQFMLLAAANHLLINAFAPAFFGIPRPINLYVSSSIEDDVSIRTGKPTGTSFLPAETVERCETGSPIEKIKLAKDGTSAFVDVYEYARKIREGEMSWEDVEAADLDTVSLVLMIDKSKEYIVTFSTTLYFNGSFKCISPHDSD